MNIKEFFKLRWVIIVSSMIIPGSGHVLLGKYTRGMLMVVWMFFFGFITYNITGPDISFIGKISGGILVWVLSVLEVYKLTSKKKSKI